MKCCNPWSYVFKAAAICPNFTGLILKFKLCGQAHKFAQFSSQCTKASSLLVMAVWQLEQFDFIDVNLGRVFADDARQRADVLAKNVLKVIALKQKIVRVLEIKVTFSHQPTFGIFNYGRQFHLLHQIIKTMHVQNCRAFSSKFKAFLCQPQQCMKHSNKQSNLPEQPARLIIL